MRLRTKLFQAYLRQEIGFFDTHESGKLLSRLNHDTQIMSSIVANNIAQCISGFVKFGKNQFLTKTKVYPGLIL